MQILQLFQNSALNDSSRKNELAGDCGQSSGLAGQVILDGPDLEPHAPPFRCRVPSRAKGYTTLPQSRINK